MQVQDSEGWERMEARQEKVWSTVLKCMTLLVENRQQAGRTHSRSLKRHVCLASSLLELQEENHTFSEASTKRRWRIYVTKLLQCLVSHQSRLTQQWASGLSHSIFAHQQAKSHSVIKSWHRRMECPPNKREKGGSWRNPRKYTKFVSNTPEKRGEWMSGEIEMSFK